MFIAILMLFYKAITNDGILTQLHGIHLDLCNDLLNVILSLLKHFSFNSIIWDYLFQFKSSELVNNKHNWKIHLLMKCPHKIKLFLH